MKKALKIILPLVLVLALLAAACWFFLFYRPDLTASFFVSRADTMAERGRYERAIRYYSWSWKLIPGDEDIPIHLAETYVAAGNYTKAEYTLVKAISSDAGNVDLYVALCKTYVAQDKLLDAVQMLDRTADPAVKAALDAMRPAAPAVSPESGYYSEYIDVSVESQEDRVYVTIDGSYPSMEADLYDAPITLPSGESNVIAIAVSSQGLVSTVEPHGYTIGGVVEEVSLSDPAVDAAVREQLGLSQADILMTDDLWSITTLTLPETVQDLTDLQNFTGLRSLTVQNVPGLDFSVLRQLTTLEELDLSSCTISSNSMQAIGALVNLKRLVLNSCALTDISPLSQLTALTELELSNNSISDISVLSLMLDLETVNLSNNPITSIAGLAPCSQLKSLDISSCSVTNLGSMSGKSKLEVLLAGNNAISDLSDLESCRSLSVLDVQSNQIDDISVLAKLYALTQFQGDSNQITAIPDFNKNHCVLQLFSVDYNQISDISGLAGLDTLNYLYADYNQIKDLSPLAEDINLIQVNVWDNPVTEDSVKALQEYSIIVNYNPNYEPPEEEPEDAEDAE